MKRTYIVKSRNECWDVDEHHDAGGSTYGDPVILLFDRDTADTVAVALNRAYADGRADQAADSRQLVQAAYELGQTDSAMRTDGAMSVVFPDDVSRETVTGDPSDPSV